LEKCNCFHIQPETKWSDYGYTTTTIYRTVCWGTRECEDCNCQGDRTRCDFYPEVRLKAQKEEIEDNLEYKISLAINFLVDNGYEVKKI